MIGLLIAIVVISIECSSGFYYERSDDLHYFWFSIVPYFGSMTFLPLFVVSLIIYFMYNKIEINVTTKRVYGIAPFNKRVDLPLDMISAVSTCIFKGIAVSTSSGVIRFRFIKNNFEIHSEISKLLNNRQDTNGFKKPSITSAADEATTKKVKNDINGYYFNIPAYIGTTYATYKLEFSSPNKFTITLRMSGNTVTNSGTYTVTKGYIVIHYDTNNTDVNIPYRYENGDITIDSPFYSNGSDTTF